MPTDAESLPHAHPSRSVDEHHEIELAGFALLESIEVPQHDHVAAPRTQRTNESAVALADEESLSRPPDILKERVRHALATRTTLTIWNPSNSGHVRQIICSTGSTNVR